ncbi:MAG TPA: zinc-dependent alcohol dehydrogenase family protein [Acidobacteriota bacterium]
MVLRRFGPAESSPLECLDSPLPEPSEGEVRIKVMACGVCHTDLHTVEGDLPEVRLPVIPGHQVVGIVEKRGRGARRFKEGDRVGAAWLFSACGACEFCLRGDENLCREGRFTGYHTDGGYAEYLVAPEKFIYALPPVFKDVEAAPLLCAGIIGYRALRLSGIRPGQRLGLYGFGASAHVAIQVARHRGCQVYVFSRSAEHRRLAEKLGAAWTGTAKDALPAGLQAAIIFAPAGELVLDALSALEPGGTLALAGITMTAIPQMDYAKHLYKERILRSVANATRRDGEELLAVAAEIPIRPTTETFRLEEANRALLRLKQGRINGAAVLVINK